MKRLTPLILLLIAMAACDPLQQDSFPAAERTRVYTPIYGDAEEVKKITLEAPRDIVKPAKIFTYNNYLIVNITNEGFHVIDNSNPAVPRNMSFISVPGSKDVAIKDGMIFSDNYADVVAFRITDAGEVEVVERLESLMDNQEYPPFRGVYFECADPTKGIVIDWVEADVENPKCYRP